ncbi:MAG: sugar phosphate nucleotidyltransferase, partial [Bacillota bacterium]
MDVKKICINRKTSIKVALKTLDETAQKILLVTNNMVLQGVITDGDIRRWILKNGDLSNPVVKIMNTDPIFLYESDRMNFRKIMKNKKLEAIPILDKDKKVKDIIFWNDNFKEKYKIGKKISNKVVIMAGGKGDRLKPFTNVFPKPLIPIGKKPIVERIINRFNRSGCNNFYLTINYKSEMIKAYFKDKNCKYKMNYIEEDKPLGTAGALFFLKNKINETFFLSNCDIII